MSGHQLTYEEYRKRTKLYKGMSAVYYIKNTTNGKFYIGCSYRVRIRIYEHIQSFKLNQHYNKLQTDWNNGDSFTIGIICIGDIDTMKIVEENLIRLNANNPKLYNVSKTKK